MSGYEFLNKDGSFRLEHAQKYKDLYFPLASDCGFKSCVTPTLAGDAKLDQNHFLFEPASIQNLKENRANRNFWALIEGEEAWSLCGSSPLQRADEYKKACEKVTVEAGIMWHKMTRTSDVRGLEATITSFVPFDANTEVHMVTITNKADHERKLTFMPALYIYGRSADNLRDHRHVTSLLNRITASEYGVWNRPTLSFDERGHRPCDALYIVEGVTESGQAPIEFFPVVDDYTGDSGDLAWPVSVSLDIKGQASGYECNGQEAMGAFRFEAVSLAPGESARYVVLAGIASCDDQWLRIRDRFRSYAKAESELERTQNYWLGKIDINLYTGDSKVDGITKWVSFQPELRRIFGCSFLPHHDYGRGGRGWRDLWQDCLALLLMNPSSVRQLLHSNLHGVRLDGTNATIIGERQGQFKADRNSITRVWMDHGFWPWGTVKLYLDQTGDFDFLFEESPYFEDGQVMRGREKKKAQGGELRHLAANKETYMGSNLEHILVQNLSAFWEVGEHNVMMLRDADWNDALDLAPVKGESVAFSAAYAGNLLSIASVLERPELKNRQINLLKEISVLLKDEDGIFESVEAKNALLSDYCKAVSGPVSGDIIRMDAASLALNLRKKGKWLMDRISGQEWHDKSSDMGWFNSYYDNDAQPLDDASKSDMMMITGQVFTISSGTADEDKVRKITRAADKYLYDPHCGGYRLNTDFKEVKMNMGRMFGFAYGEKENGAVFSHMAVMYANALYKRGFAAEGHKVLKSLLDTAADFETSRIYPGIPEYFGRGGRGLYHYLTGAGSWFFLTEVTEVFGVCGDGGDLVIRPRLTAEQFDKDKMAIIDLPFADRMFRIELLNQGGKDFGSYKLTSAMCDGKEMELKDNELRISMDELGAMDDERVHKIDIILG
ncbi:GH36-type glycosyl hydrolase domain-containing protein [Butyrivibrio sp. MC2013]|uniref:GH36-type glycosyl hydrolase domain-containing protein n=1 Tax=Butyrivibrio sp. MC2013 TaxID=1280686 RepID=UPI000412E1CE|nr:hypothetical protein [Butyrivibrio sp. MC2013]